MLKEFDKITASEELIQETLEFCRANAESNSTSGEKVAKESSSVSGEKVAYMAHAGGMTQEYGKNSKAAKLTRKVNRWAVAVAACAAAIVLTSGAALAYNAVTGENIISNISNKIYKVRNTASSLNYSDGVTDANGNTYTYEDLVDVSQVRTDKNLTVTLDSYVVDGSKAEVMFTVSTNDGSSLNNTTEDIVPVIARDKFADATVTVDGVALSSDNYYQDAGAVGGFWQTRVDDGSDPSKATIKIEIMTSMSTLNGTTLGFKLGNYTSQYNITESIGFKYSSVAEMLEGVTLAGEESFTGSNPYGYTLANSDVTLEKGNLHIEFSDEFAGSYIDNAGITTKNSYNGVAQFFMTIVPANEAAAEELCKLCFQNTTSGSSLLDGVIERLDDGRIQMVYSASFDRTFTDELGYNIDTDLTYLASQVLKKRIATGYEIALSTGAAEVSFECPVTQRNGAIEFASDIIVNDTVNTDVTINIKNVKISTTELSMDGSITSTSGENTKFAGGGVYSPLFTMKNGTTFNAGNKLSAGWSALSHVWDAEWILPTYINPEDVESITWHGSVIYQAQ
jgi:hypothetical protein